MGFICYMFCSFFWAHMGLIIISSQLFEEMEKLHEIPIYGASSMKNCGGAYSSPLWVSKWYWGWNKLLLPSSVYRTNNNWCSDSNACSIQGFCWELVGCLLNLGSKTLSFASFSFHNDITIHITIYFPVQMSQEKGEKWTLIICR